MNVNANVIMKKKKSRWQCFKETVKAPEFWLGVVGGPMLFVIFMYIIQFLEWREKKILGFVPTKCPICKRMIAKGAFGCWNCRSKFKWVKKSWIDVNNEDE